MDTENYEQVQNLIQRVREISILTDSLKKDIYVMESKINEVNELIDSVEKMESEFYYKHLTHTIENL